VEILKEEAEKTGRNYQAMISDVLDAYAYKYLQEKTI